VPSFPEIVNVIESVNTIESTLMEVLRLFRVIKGRFHLEVKLKIHYSLINLVRKIFKQETLHVIHPKLCDFNGFNFSSSFFPLQRSYVTDY
jgi:hypothetical protein